MIRSLFDENRTSKSDVFATTREINVKEMEAIGFDYDYTLANYSPEIQVLIYNMVRDHQIQLSSILISLVGLICSAWFVKERIGSQELTLSLFKARDYMVNSLKYPQEFLQWATYDPNFAIRGLYYDTAKGNIMKLDYLNNLQPDSMYFGKKALTKQQIIKQYGTLHVSTSYFPTLRAMIDNFSLPETCLISDAIEFFVQNKISFDPASVGADITKAIRFIHTTLSLHNEVLKDLPRYMRGQRPRLSEFLHKLNRKQRKLFLLTNSPYYFVDAGMTYMLGKEWRDLFDVVITSADKPSWFTGVGRPFRRYHVESQQIAWDRVAAFERSQVYVGGSMDQFTKMIKVNGWQTLYLGDHIFSDLREPSRTQGWRTGAIVSELEKEIEIQKTLDYNDTLVEMMKLQDLRNKLDMLAKDKEATCLFDIKADIKRLRHSLKVMTSSPSHPYAPMSACLSLILMFPDPL